MDPLKGIRVLDFSRHLAGAGATRILANFGAEVIRVEWPEHPALDFLRFMVPAEGVVGLNRGGLFNSINVDKLSVTLNLKHPEAADIARRLLASCDVLAENMTPRVMKSFGLDYDRARAVRPDLIYLSVSGWGHDGPRRDFRSYGASSAAHSGVAFMAGLPGRPPSGWQFAFCDHNPAWQGAIAVMMALHNRRRTGQGTFIDLAQTQASTTYIAQYLLDCSVNGRTFGRPGFPPGSARVNPPAAPHNAFPCLGDDKWCAIAVFTDEEWAGLKSAMGDPAWAREARFASARSRFDNQAELEERLSTWTRKLERYRLAALLQEHGVPAGVVQTAQDRLDWDEQLAHRGTFQVYHHPEVGPRRHETVGARLSNSPYSPRRAAPLIGQDNDYVLRGLLGLTTEELRELEARDVIRSPAQIETALSDRLLGSTGEDAEESSPAVQAPPRVSRPASLGPDPASNPHPASCLDGLMVLELGDEATQYCGKQLADMGARLLKIELPHGAACRRRGPFKDDRPDPNGSIYFWTYNTSKESVVLDLGNEADRARLRNLAGRADIILEDFKPGYLDSIGLGYADLCEENPGLIMTSVTPFGTTGPLKHWKSCDLVNWAMGGNMWLVGYSDPATPPICPHGDLSYVIVGHWACIGTMAALMERDATGRGQQVDVSMQEACSFCTEGSVPSWEYMGPGGTFSHRTDYVVGALLCSDERYFVPQMTNITPAMWSRFVEWLKQENAGDEFHDPKYYDPEVLQPRIPDVIATIGEIARRKTSQEMWLAGQNIGFTWMVFNTPEDLLNDEQLNYRKFFQQVEHPEHQTSFAYAGAPYHVSAAPWRITRRPPLLGEHNAALEELMK